MTFALLDESGSEELAPVSIWRFGHVVGVAPWLPGMRSRHFELDVLRGFEQ